jgi:molybdate transport repressor ModE-like protein
MKLRPALQWQLDDRNLDVRLLPLLRAIANSGSLKQAVGAVGLSYRHAWGLLGQFETALGQRLVDLQRGRGALLTPLGEKLLATEERLKQQLETQFTRLATELGQNLEASPATANNTIAVQASHDMALGKLRDLLAATHKCDIELHFQGSLDCLAALARGQCDLAGFHVPDTSGRNTLLDQYRPWLKTKTLRLVHFATRTQGLMVAKGNPLGINTLANLVRAKARFVNRQPGSGTRLFFDHLLAAHKIRPSQINGYRFEEFTHAAVAATIASGMADAGFGIGAAAEQQKIDFMPIATERYFLAARAVTWTRPGPAALLAALRAGALKKVLKTMSGYTLPLSLDLLAIDDALRTE